MRHRSQKCHQGRRACGESCPARTGTEPKHPCRFRGCAGAALRARFRTGQLRGRTPRRRGRQAGGRWRRRCSLCCDKTLRRRQGGEESVSFFAVPTITRSGPADRHGRNALHEARGDFPACAARVSRGLHDCLNAGTKRHTGSRTIFGPKRCYPSLGARWMPSVCPTARQRPPWRSPEVLRPMSPTAPGTLVDRRPWQRHHSLSLHVYRVSRADVRARARSASGVSPAEQAECCASSKTREVDASRATLPTSKP